MNYRKFGKLDFNVSALGFGAMRLPVIENDIDEKQATEMLYHAIDNGVNYVDTAYLYHGGMSEVWLGKALSGNYKSKIKIATKLPSWEIRQQADFDKYFNEQLKRLQTNRIDFYLLHALNKDWWPNLMKLGVIEWAESKIKSGQIGHLGFSFHDDYETFEGIINDYDWTFCQIQYNFMDIDNQAGDKGLKLAHEKGMAVIIMEPLLGGRLVNPPPAIQNIWDDSPVKRSSTEWALQWLWNQKEISLVLSGMSSLQHVEDNIKYSQTSGIGRLSKDELNLFERVRKTYRDLILIPCTKCGYCMPCPKGVNIPRNFEAYNNGYMYDKIDAARGEYEWIGQSFKLGLSKTDERALNCVQCKACEKKCPQKIQISAWMKNIHEVLGEDREYIKGI